MFSRLMHGYVEVWLYGEELIRLIQLWKNHGIPIWNLRKQESAYSCCMMAADLKKSRAWMKKTGSHFHIGKRKGLPFFVFRNRFRLLSYLWAVLTFTLLWVMGHFLWNIDFQGNVKYSDKVLEQFLQTQGVGLGMALSQIDGEQLEWEIRNTYGDITWVSVEVQGTKMTVHLNENDGYLTEKEVSQEPANLCAETAGQVISIVTRKGVPQVTVGQEVEAGQVLISGEVPFVSDSGEAYAYHYLRAEGDVVLSYELPVELVESRSYKKRQYVKEQVFPYLEAFGQRFSFFFGADTNHTEVTITRRQYCIKNAFFLPLYEGEVTLKYYEEVEESYGEEELKQVLEEKINKYMEEIEKTGVQIIENRVTIKVNNAHGIASGSFLVSKEQDFYADIEHSTINNEGD